jgi:hypothetical protein
VRRDEPDPSRCFRICNLRRDRSIGCAQ